MSAISKFLTAFAAGATAAALMAPAPALAQDSDTIVLGAALSITGRLAASGNHTQKGYDLAVKRVNEMGGIMINGKKYKIAVKYYDDESTPARGAQLAERLILQDKVKYMLGPYGSGVTKAIAPITEKHNILMVEGNGASRSLFTQGYKNLFAVLATAEQYLPEAIALAVQQAEKDGRDPKTLKVAMAMENDPFSQDVRLGLLEDIKKFGLDLIIDDKLPPDLSDMSATLNKVRALKPDILLVSGHTKGAALVTRQMAEMRVSVPMLAITHCDSARVEDTEKFGTSGEGTLCAFQWAPELDYEDEWFGSASDYAATFEDEYGYVPPYQAAESTAAVLVFVDAFRRAQSFETDKLRKALVSTDLKTFYGNIKFDDVGRNIAKPMILQQIQNGKYVPVAPSDTATGEFIPKPTS